MERHTRLELSRLQFNSVAAMELKRAERTGTEPRPTEEILVEIFRTNVENEALDHGYHITTPLDEINPDMRWVEVLPAKDRVEAVKHLVLEATYTTDEPEEPAEAISSPVEAI